MTNFTKYLLSLFIVALMPAVTSCGDDNDEPEPDAGTIEAIGIPDDAVYLNMMNESNGKSLLGNTDVYLSDSENFVSPSKSSISCSDGRYQGIGFPPCTAQIFSQIAVTPSKYKLYQIFPNENIHRFPSGTNALKNKSYYIGLCIDSWIKKGGKIIGAKVAFLENIANPYIEIDTDTYIYSSSKDGEVIANPVSYANRMTHEIEIISITPNISNISIKDNGADYLKITTVGPVTADIKVYVRQKNIYTINTIHITPSSD